ncbi:hypothetical protein WR25_06675 [Diploscapter pachys]|uniref:Uncharacterized protein n=1 Tax=Diploscapter pachys TaxID=2018661 RepID=A0A2A2K0V0_9BILA|nr:hypothetical protein WR25_06675 [Diploscapter pachys]
MRELSVSGASHLIGSRTEVFILYDEATFDRPKSEILTTFCSSYRQFLAAMSLWMTLLLCRYLKERNSIAVRDSEEDRFLIFCAHQVIFLFARPT